MKIETKDEIMVPLITRSKVTSLENFGLAPCTPTFEGWTDILRDGKVITDWLWLIDAHGPRERLKDETWTRIGLC